MQANAWREVSIQSLIYNYQSILRFGGLPICAVIKADAYGHGAQRLGHLYEALGASMLAVATLAEGVALRKNGIRIPILILGFTPPCDAEILEAYELTQTVGDPNHIEGLNNAVKGGVLSVHLKIDTGMSRYGIGHTAFDMLDLVAKCANLRLTGVYTHYATADEGASDPLLRRALARFAPWRKEAHARFGDEVIVHDCNSALLLSGLGQELARVGILLYGYPPSATLAEKLPLIPAMTLKSRVVALHTLCAGESVGYGCAYTAKSRKRIATISIGYADGLPRAASGYSVYIRGIPCPILGNICMDACMVDVTHLATIEVGEVVTIFGGEANGANLLARQAESIPYEILARIGTRAPLHYC